MKILERVSSRVLGNNLASKVLGGFLCTSMLSSGLLLACPDMHSHQSHMDGNTPKAPSGVVQDLYAIASVKQKRQILQIDFDSQKAVKTQIGKIKEVGAMIDFDIKSLKLDLEEAKSNKDTARITDTLFRIAKKQEELRKNRQDEQNLRYLLEEDKVKKINAVLKVR